MARSSTTTQNLHSLADLQVLEQWAFMRVGPVLLLCTRGDKDAPESDVDAWLARLTRRDYGKLLVHSDGGAPDAKQRARLAAFWQTAGAQPPCAVLTDSPVARMAMTAMNWISKFELRAFAEKDLEGALRYLDEPNAAAELRELIAMLRRALENKKRAT